MTSSVTTQSPQATKSPELPEWLFPFQKEDVLKQLGVRSSLIGNEMGTGKTYEAIALDLARRSLTPTPKKTLVVAPLTILETVWVEHYNKLAPHLKVYMVDHKARAGFLKALKEPYDIYVCHWEGVRLMEESLRQVKWFHVIADEVHRAKSRKAQQTRSLKKIPAEFKTGLSGTPVMNKPHDLWSILNWLYPTTWRSYWKFYENYVDFEIIYPNGYHKIRGPKNEEHLKEVMAPFFTRRLKREVMKDLPEKYYTKIEVELYPQQRRAYNQMKKDMIAWLEHQDDTKPLVAPVVIAQLMRLQQLSIAYADIVPFGTQGASASGVMLTDPSSKIDTLMELINDNPEESIVVFSQFKGSIRIIESRLNKAGIRYSRITGDDSADVRRRSVEDFQSGKSRVFLGTIGAGSEGITLTASSTVVFLDRDWTPARNAQAEDRLHRHGQKNAVQVIDIVGKNTVDSYRFMMLEMKKDWIRRMIGD